MREIIIKNTKNIKQLNFKLPEQNGVFLLVGANGSGKTTLLTCLDRICNPYAFALGFISSNKQGNIDQYHKSEIEYKVDSFNVKFSKKTARWSPSPRNQSSKLKNSFNFNDTIFIKADSKRIEIPQDEIKPGNFVPVDVNIINSLNKIFETEKYLDLKRLKNVNGRGRNSTYYYLLKEGSKYYSEKRFSTGELAIIRLVEQLNSTDNNTLLLLDEAEMALHPRIQKNLLDYLVKMASSKCLTIIVSTHSVTMIKSTPKSNIMLMENQTKGKLKVSSPCYPAKAIGYVDFESNIIFDNVFFVEDDMARLVLKAMLNKYISITPDIDTLMYCIVPVGGYEQTTLLAKNTRKQLLERSNVFAVLDDDVFTEAIKTNQKFATLYSECKDYTFSLKCTPESWLIERLEAKDTTLAQRIRDTYHCEIDTILINTEYLECKSQKPRKLAKQKVDCVLKILADRCGDSKDIILKTFVDLLIECEMNDGKIRSIIAPILKK